MKHAALPIVLFLVLASLAQAQFVNYESTSVHPIRFSPDGSRLFAVDTFGGSLSVWDTTNPGFPVLMKEIPVGLEPVSVTPRSAVEVWVCNILSDTVSVVDVVAGRVVADIRVVDEPSDVVFAAGRAFVSAATRDEIHVFDAATLAPLGIVPVFGKDPRALAVSADGTKVFALIQRSGNGSTIIPEALAPPQPAPTNPALPNAPQASLIVRADDPAWSSVINYTLPDNDVIEIDAATLAVTRQFTDIGTTNYDLVVHPSTGELFVANTKALNLVRFETVLRGHVVDSQVTRVTTGPVPAVNKIDLNPTVSYVTLPNPPALGIALSEPTGLALDAASNLLYVAAQGTDRIGVLDIATNTITARIEVGGTPGAAVDTANKRGPRGLALHPTGNWLMVHNRLSDTVSVIDTNLGTVTAEFGVSTTDHVPANVRLGRKFLYDSKLSGNGTLSCASCHIDGDSDGIAWDLGDPGGQLQSPPAQPFPFNIGLVSFHPMKGPMVTQTLRGLGGTEPLHWRGDRNTFQDFNGAFASLLGGSMLSTNDMDTYALFATTIAYPPNPNQKLDRTFRTTPANANEQTGFNAFNQSVGSIGLGPFSCATCHALPTGTNGLIISGPILQETQQMKVPQLRNMYRKDGFDAATGPQKSGFGFIHDGSLPTMMDFLNQPVFQIWPQNTKDDMVAFMLALDTGTAPTTGYRSRLDATTAGTPTSTADIALLEGQAGVGAIDLVAIGAVDGEPRGYHYQPGPQNWATDLAAAGTETTAALVALAQAGNADLVLMGVPFGSGQRIALDADGDGSLNGDEGLAKFGVASATLVPDPLLDGSSEPFVGNTQFSLVMERGPAFGNGVLLLSAVPSSFVVGSLTIEVDFGPGFIALESLVADQHGARTLAAPLPTNPAIAGFKLYMQTLWYDLTEGFWTGTRGLEMTITP